MSDWNETIIAEFRENEGRVGGPFEGAHLLLLGTTGAKSGAHRVSPMMYFAESGGIYVIASKGGAPDHPAWYHNLVANPTVSVEQSTDAGIESYRATASVVTGARRDSLFAIFSAKNPGFGDYQKRTKRTIPVVELTRVA